ncbi:MAG: hypothetical protein P0S95_08120 [Rhabdochlamydiaceae bacterium]|nr:hypothetical protein [Candidatus Amphrikana amoebophyrae]
MSTSTILKLYQNFSGIDGNLPFWCPSCAHSELDQYNFDSGPVEKQV